VRTTCSHPIEHTARIIELLPKAEAIRVENCGHLGMIEKHDIFNGALDRLLARVRAELSDNAR
jgi:pimeloyl-ACP methyl ester carboxylesterase